MRNRSEGLDDAAEDGFSEHLHNPANDGLNGYSVKLDLL